LKKPLIVNLTPGIAKRKKVPMPKKILVGTRVSRIWTTRALERVKQYNAKFYRKGRKRRDGAGRGPWLPTLVS